jgi:hypothetical protein
MGAKRSGGFAMTVVCPHKEARGERRDSVARIEASHVKFAIGAGEVEQYREDGDE